MTMRPIEIHDRGRGPELKGTRITVYDVIPYLRSGSRVDTIALWLGIRIAEVEALIRYIEEHKEEVMAVNARIEERIAHGNPPEIEAKLAGGRAKLAKLKAELQQRRTRPPH
jgi:uncharacterized protein (DUF433 family)